MGRDEIRKGLETLQAYGDGEILYETTEGIAWYDYVWSDGDNAMFFRFPEHCTEEMLQKLVFVGDEAGKKGVTKNLIARILSDAYAEMLPDMMAVLRAVLIVSGDADPVQYAKREGIDPEEILEDLGYPEGVCGRMWRRRQTAVVYADAIEDHVEDRQEFLRGIGATLIHECRHVMLDCNPLLDDERYPDSIKTEPAVEAFCRERWDVIGWKYEKEVEP